MHSHTVCMSIHNVILSVCMALGIVHVHVTHFSGRMHVHLLFTDLERTSTVCRSSTTAPVTENTVTDRAATTASKFVKDRFTMHMHVWLHKTFSLIRMRYPMHAWSLQRWHLHTCT